MGELVQQGVPLWVVRIGSQRIAKVGELAILGHSEPVLCTCYHIGRARPPSLAVDVLIQVQGGDVVGHGARGWRDGIGARKVSAREIRDALARAHAIHAHAIKGLIARELVGNHRTRHRIGLIASIRSKAHVKAFLHGVGVATKRHHVRARFQLIARKTVSICVVHVIAGHVTGGKLDGHGLGSTRLKQACLGKSAQLKGALFDTARRVGRREVQLDHVLARNRARVGHLHVHGQRVISRHRSCRRVHNLPVKARV